MFFSWHDEMAEIKLTCGQMHIRWKHFTRKKIIVNYHIKYDASHHTTLSTRTFLAKNKSKIIQLPARIVCSFYSRIIPFNEKLNKKDNLHLTLTEKLTVPQTYKQIPALFNIFCDHAFTTRTKAWCKHFTEVLRKLVSPWT